ncbi:hypothetical protein O181_042158 [Austropuccinia psidii MF-1]|uniref:Uncharacterized protein n=1 Tax=Austropuccinia psidii MF-1 TaxID=1389203 RepID=A0A9Q3DIU0_9BASI|nr:hypothetical protein [Austropuccinia psidii MF-1]
MNHPNFEYLLPESFKIIFHIVNEGIFRGHEDLSIKLKEKYLEQFPLVRDLTTVWAEQFTQPTLCHVHHSVSTLSRPLNSPQIVANFPLELLEAAVEAQIPFLSKDEQARLEQLAHQVFQLQNAKAHGVDLHGCQYLFSLLHFLDDPSQYKCSIGFDPTHNLGVLFAQLCTCQHLLAQETMSLLTSYPFKQTRVGPQLSLNTA